MGTPDLRDQRREGITAKYLNDLVFLRFVDFPGEAAARESVVDDEFVGFEAGLFEKFGTCTEKPEFTCVQHTHRSTFLHVRGGDNSPVYSGAGEVPLEPVSHSLSPLGFASLLGVMQAGEFGRLWQEKTINTKCSE